METLNWKYLKIVHKQSTRTSVLSYFPPHTSPQRNLLMSTWRTHTWTAMADKHTLLRGILSAGCEPSVASETPGRRTVTQRENVSAQYGKRSSHHSEGPRSVLAESRTDACWICRYETCLSACNKIPQPDSLMNFKSLDLTEHDSVCVHLHVKKGFKDPHAVYILFT